MVEYHLSLYQPSRHRLKVTVTLPCPDDETTLYIAAWRPGRYEEGNFASLISHVQGFDQNNQRVRITKGGKNEWLADTRATDFITLSYLYYGSVLTAGNTFLDESKLLINPVNVLIYNKYIFDKTIRLSLDLPDEWKVCGLEHQENTTVFNGIDRLFDSPFLAAPGIKTNEYRVNGKRFFIHHLGNHSLDLAKLIKDFEAFTVSQIQAFGSFPVDVFSFLLIGTNTHYLHGVEHLNNTIIVLGPTDAWHSSRYLDLLHVASHELYHVWNVKSIRPADLLPYRFQEINYSRLGYVYEGITTYMGDYHLLKSKVITTEEYLVLFSALVQNHIDNPGRYSMSLGDSSIDTWVDGYVQGTPGKKVSIYNEGALIAFYIDYRIRAATQNKRSIHTFMQQLYQEFGNGIKGYEEEDLLRILMDLSGIDFKPFFESYIHAANGYETLLTEAFEYFGISYKPVENPILSERELGLKAHRVQGSVFIHAIARGGPSDLGGLAEKDEIVSVNGLELNQPIEEILRNRIENEVTIGIRRQGVNKEITLPVMQKTFFPRVTLSLTGTETHQIHKNRAHFGLQTTQQID